MLQFSQQFIFWYYLDFIISPRFHPLALIPLTGVNLVLLGDVNLVPLGDVSLLLLGDVNLRKVQIIKVMDKGRNLKSHPQSYFTHLKF